MDINRYRLPGFEKRFTRTPRNRAYLMILRTHGRPPNFFKESSEEMGELARAAGIQVMGTLQANLSHPSPSHFLREGKLSELKEHAQKAGANVLIFNVDLTPGQAGNIEAFAQVPVMDRTGLILDIFARRARSREGKLQVELAQLSYALPRLGGLGKVMSRLGGGVGTRGPGEQELERDRRKVRRRIQQVKEELLRVRNHRQRIRSSRRKRQFLSIALVGYTNAGKSTLLNALTGADAYVEDKMFATLDPLARMREVDGRYQFLFVDTVGFLRDLPHTLVEAFHATLEEVSEVDGLIHVLDGSKPNAREYKEAVEKVLAEIKAEKKPILFAINKADLMNDEQRQWAIEEWPNGILISAKHRLGMESLIAKLKSFASKFPSNEQT